MKISFCLEIVKLTVSLITEVVDVARKHAYQDVPLSRAFSIFESRVESKSGYKVSGVVMRWGDVQVHYVGIAIKNETLKLIGQQRQLTVLSVVVSAYNRYFIVASIDVEVFISTNRVRVRLGD